jgi:DNA-binding beta-propeller fold protein YncE
MRCGRAWLSDQVTYASTARAQALRHSLSQTPRAILRPAGRGTMAYYAFPGWRWRSAPGLLSCPDSRLDWRCYCCFTCCTGVARYWKGVFVSSMIRRCVLSGVLLATFAFAPAVTASAQGTLEPTAPENLRCPGRPGPRDGYHFEVQWQSFATFPAVDLEGTGRPRQVALDHACDLFVADMGGNQIVKFNPDGQQVAAWKMPERPVGDDGVEGVAVAPDGSVYVADRSQSKVYKLDASGKQVATWKSCDCEPGTPGWLVSPISVAVDGTGNNVYVLDSAANSVSRYSPDGKVQKIIGGDGDGPGQLSSPRQVGLDRQGNVYVADWGHDRIEKYSPDGNVLGQFGTSGADAGQIHLPTGVAVAADGSLYVSDSDNWRVMQLAPDGTPLEQYPACAGPDDCGVLAGSDIGQFSEHSSLSVDGQGNLYVADTGNDRIQRRIVVEVPNPPRASVLQSSEN